MVGNGDPVGVTAKIVQYILRAAKGGLGVDDPVLSEQWPKPSSEDLRLSEQCQISGKVKLALLKGRVETVDELGAKHTPEQVDGEKEAWVGWNPASVIERDPTGRDDTVDMGMKLEFLVPGVQHTEKADLGAKIPGIASDFQ
jgi:hypothetical protein